MKKTEEIKMLKHELGRYQKKVGDQAKEIAELRKAAKCDIENISGLNRAADMLAAQMCLSFGTDVKDDDGNHIGYRLEIPVPNEEVWKKYGKRAEVKDGIMTIGLALLKEEKADDKA